MTSIWEALRRRFRGQQDLARQASFSYEVYWAKTARLWTPEHRAQALQAVRGLLSRSEFVTTLYDRTYRLEEVDATPHAGASLVALQRVLEALPTESHGELDHER